jgi:hypothetical protein
MSRKCSPLATLALPSKHHVLEEVREARAAPLLHPRAHVVVHRDRHRRGGVVGDITTRSPFSRRSTLPYGINLGASYRVTYASLDRRIESDAGKVVDLSLSGLNFASFRLGAQWAAIEEETIEAADAYRRLSFGLMYRHKTSIDLTADSATVFGSPVSDAETTFILPSRLVFGTRGDWGRFGGAVDVEYGFNSQNDVSKISGTCVQTGGCTGGIDEGAKASFSSVFDWKNAITLRTGLEYRLLEAGRLKPRVGYIFDGTTSSKQYPTGFGTPPAPHALDHARLRL